MSEQKNIESQFVDYETAKMLKELGFDEGCIAHYGTHNTPNGKFNKKTLEGNALSLCAMSNSDLHESKCAVPVWQQVEQWLWDKGIHVNVSCHKGIINKPKDFTACSLDVNKKEIIAVVSRAFDSPVTAKTEGVKKAIKHLHSKK